jgi:hypothetical protein
MQRESAPLNRYDLVAVYVAPNETVLARLRT